jgi:transcription initiation factor IIE alpha subunit
MSIKEWWINNKDWLDPYEIPDNILKETLEALERLHVLENKNTQTKVMDKEPNGYICPACKERIYPDTDINYCALCGQKLEW